MSDTIKINIKGLQALSKALKEKAPIAQVGVLGAKTSRRDTSQTNAGIGAKHEFGEDGMPMRSFLRAPLIEKMGPALEKAGLYEQKVFKQVIREKSLKPLVEKIGIIGEAVVLGAFDSGGYGKWKPSNMTYKKNQQTLVETKQLRESISSRVK